MLIPDFSKVQSDDAPVVSLENGQLVVDHRPVHDWMRDHGLRVEDLPLVWVSESELAEGYRPRSAQQESLSIPAAVQALALPEQQEVWQNADDSELLGIRLSRIDGWLKHPTPVDDAARQGVNGRPGLILRSGDGNVQWLLTGLDADHRNAYGLRMDNERVTLGRVPLKDALSQAPVLVVDREPGPLLADLRKWGWAEKDVEYVEVSARTIDRPQVGDWVRFEPNNPSDLTASPFSGRVIAVLDTSGGDFRYHLRAETGPDRGVEARFYGKNGTFSPIRPEEAVGFDRAKTPDMERLPNEAASLARASSRSDDRGLRSD